ncbi:GNAT family N-acetyltransferase [bacterium]|nr:GNAT family N-acetyltransferase [bacterium]
MTDTAAGPGADVHHPAPDFINGQLTRLRPVLERDLEGLVELLNEAPLGFNWEGYPWSLPRLKKKFEDEKEPGLWGQRQRFLAATDLDGALVGVLHEEQERSGQVGLEFHFALARSDRGQLGPDALQAYMDYKRNWFNTPRIECNLLSPQEAEIGWLLALGFIHDMSCQRVRLHLGQAAALEIFSWCQPWVLANRAADGIGA